MGFSQFKIEGFSLLSNFNLLPYFVGVEGGNLNLGLTFHMSYLFICGFCCFVLRNGLAL